MTTEIDITTDAAGIRDLIALRKTLRGNGRGGGNAAARDNNSPIVVELSDDLPADDFEQHAAQQVRLVTDGNRRSWQQVRLVNVRKVTSAAISAGTTDNPTRLIARRVPTLGWCVQEAKATPVVVLQTPLAAADDYFAARPDLPWAWARFVAINADGSSGLDFTRDAKRVYNRREGIEFPAGTPGTFEDRLGVDQFSPDDCGSSDSSSYSESYDLDDLGSEYRI